MRRRDFLKTVASVGLGASLYPNIRLLANDEPIVKPKVRWYKGNIHCHSQWSDSKDLPEVVVDTYKTRGFDFLSLTDHNILQKDDLRFDGFCMNYEPSDRAPFKDETSFWKKLAPQDGWPNLIEAHLQLARDRFGADSVITKKTADGTYVRMKTLKELQAQFAEKDKFLMIPGFEMTAQYVHANLINVDEVFTLEGPDMGQLLIDVFDRATELYSGNKDPYIFTANHPIWQYYNLQPSYFFPRPNMRFLELTNNDTKWQIIPGAWTPETFWDIVNAYRATRDQPLVYTTGTDDNHGGFRNDYIAFHSWTRVRAERLETNALLNAMNQGASYVSNGPEFEEISFDGKTLAVKAIPRVEGEYRIEFIGTKKDYPTDCKIIDVDGSDGRPARKVESYSEEIGKTLETFDGLEGSYTLKPDDLYVRAKVYRVGAGNARHAYKGNGAPISAESAWTQPYRQGDSL